jgi:hypothetical protein
MTITFVKPDGASRDEGEVGRSVLSTIERLEKLGKALTRPAPHRNVEQAPIYAIVGRSVRMAGSNACNEYTYDYTEEDVNGD